MDIETRYYPDQIGHLENLVGLIPQDPIRDRFVSKQLPRLLQENGINIALLRGENYYPVYEHFVLQSVATFDILPSNYSDAISASGIGRSDICIYLAQGAHEQGVPEELFVYSEPVIDLLRELWLGEKYERQRRGYARRQASHMYPNATEEDDVRGYYPAGDHLPRIDPNDPTGESL